MLILSLFLSTHLEKGMWGQQQGAIYKSGKEASAGTSAQSLSLVPFSVTPWTAVCQASLSISNSRSLLKLMSIKSVMASNPLLLCHPLLLSPSVFPSIRVFSNESVLQRADRMKNLVTPYRLEMRADSLSSNEEVAIFPQVPQEEFSLRNMYVRGTLCFMLQQNGPRDALIRKNSKFPCRGIMHAHRSYHKMKGCLSPL